MSIFPKECEASGLGTACLSRKLGGEGGGGGCGGRLEKNVTQGT